MKKLIALFTAFGMMCYVGTSTAFSAAFAYECDYSCNDVNVQSAILHHKEITSVIVCGEIASVK